MTQENLTISTGPLCVIFGVNGQDGGYLAEHLLGRGYSVVGVGRQVNCKWEIQPKNFTYCRLDLADVKLVVKFLKMKQPSIIFYVAAVHGASGFLYEDHWIEANCVNTLSLHACLEYLRKNLPTGKLIFFSSSKAFGSNLPEVITEETKRISTCIYSITKNSATDLIIYYQSRHNINANVIWTFNHESPRRSSDYFIPKLVHILANAILDRQYVGEIGTLSFWCDWGSSHEYMEIAVDIMETSARNNFVLATGETRWAKDFVIALFLRYGLQASNHIIEKEKLEGKKSPYWNVDTSYLEEIIGKKPIHTIYEVCDDILRINYPSAWAKCD